LKKGLTEPLESVIILIMKYLINLLSRIQAHRFSKAYRKGSSTQHDLLQSYVGLRQALPTMKDGNHWGNHKGSGKKPFRATQGF